MKRDFHPTFDFFPERFWFAVEGWSDREIAQYLRLLSHQWLRDGLPESTKEVTTLARGKVSDRVLDKFPKAQDGLRRNDFLEQIRSRQIERMKSTSQKAAKAAKARWHKESGPVDDAGGDAPSNASSNAPSIPQASPQASSKQCLSNALHSPSPSTISTLHSHESGSVDEKREMPMADRAPTLEVIKAWGSRILVPDECAEIFWNGNEARGLTPDGYWQDRDGNPIRNPQAAFRAFATAYKSNRNKSATNQHETHRRNPARTDSSTNNASRYS
jgi:hypothetical protein